MTEPDISDEADPLYQSLAGLESWAAAPVDEVAWARAVDRLRALRPDDRCWRDMVVGQGALLAAAHQSGALDGLYASVRERTVALLRGDISMAALDDGERAHVRANYDALRLARAAAVSERSVRRIHEVACRPQLTHRVRVGDAVEDHVLAAGDYKHHPNHVLAPSGEWQATAPVAQVRSEMARLVEAAGSTSFAGLHPAAQAAYLQHGLTHVQPFADGNGRVARALASGCLLRAAGIPLLVFADGVTSYHAARESAALVDVVLRRVLTLVDLLDELSEAPETAALGRWRELEEIAGQVRASLGAAVAQGLDRYRRRGDLTRRADLSAAAVMPGEPLVVRVPLEHGVVVDEVVAVDAHPVDGGPVVVSAKEAQLTTEAGAPLEAWVDRVISCLALRVAAELEE